MNIHINADKMSHAAQAAVLMKIMEAHKEATRYIGPEHQHRPAPWTLMPKYAKRFSKPKATSRRRGLNSVSATRRKLLTQYERQKRSFLALHPICEICKHRKSTDVHHTLGRGPNLLNESTWMALDRQCHDFVHQNPKWAFEKGYLCSRLAKSGEKIFRSNL